MDSEMEGWWCEAKRSHGPCNTRNFSDEATCSACGNDHPAAPHAAPMDSETQAPLKANDPRMVAWQQYIASEEYANAKRWAVIPEHTEGSMWAAFLAGWETRPPAARASHPEARKP